MQPTRLFVIECAPQTAVASRWAKTLQTVGSDGVYWLPNPESPAHPHGTSMHAVLRKLAHPHRTQEHRSSAISPDHYRTLRGVLHGYKQHKEPVHVVGVLDAHSPHGNWHTTEQLLRFLHESGVATVVHLGSWHPTPSEIRQHLRELVQWQSPHLTLGSLFALHNPSHDLEELFTTFEDRPCVDLHHVSFPVRHTVRLADVPRPRKSPVLVIDGITHRQRHAPLEDESQFVSLYNHGLPNERVQSMTKNHKHLMVLASHPSYEKTFVGADMHHPYYEHWLHDSPEDLLELYLSPHFGYHTSPHRLYAFIHDEPKKSLDGLVSHALRHKDEPFACCFIQPDTLAPNLVISNMDLKRDRNLYHELAEHC